MSKRRADTSLENTPKLPRHQQTGRDSTSDFILSTGFIASFPCDQCLRAGVDCVMDRTRRYSKCATCTRQGHTCRREFHTSKEWDLLKRAEEKVSSDIEQAENELDLLEPELSSLQDHLARLHKQLLGKQQAFQTAMSRQRRLRKQQAFLKQRGFRMSEHDTELLRILDEKSSEQPDPPVVEVQQLAATSDNPDFNQMLEEIAQMPPAFWENVDVSAGGIPSPSGDIPSSS